MKRFHAIFAVIFVIALTVAVPDGRKSSNAKKSGSGGPYKHGAVATDATNCSKIGAKILESNGSAVDAAIASMLCVGVINMESTGVAGGGMMMIYSQETGTSEVVDFREKAPASSTKDMFKGKKEEAEHGGHAIGVPGEVAGYHDAWKKHGKLTWAEIVQPAADLAKKGFVFESAAHDAAVRSIESIKKDPGLRELLLDKDENVHKVGDVITNPKYAATLETIRDDPEGFYKGSLAEKILEDMRVINGSVTRQDLLNYRPEIRKTLKFDLGDLTMHLTPPPAGGSVVGMILNILKGYKLTPSDRRGENAGLTYYRIVEAFKFAYAWRSRLGDPAFVNNISSVVKEMLNPATGDFLRGKITSKTHEQSYYGKFFDVEDHGTSHLSVLAPNGDAVALTSTINNWFGCGYRSNTTGIIYNDEMEDFDNPGDAEIGGLYPNVNNFPAPGKRPLSSVSPTVITDKQGARLVLGASGGKKIIAAVSLVTVNKFWFNRKLSDAVDDPRLYCSLAPSANVTIGNKLEYRLPADIVQELEDRGDVVSIDPNFSAIQAVFKENKRTIYAKSDSRKKGEPAGF